MAERLAQRHRVAAFDDSGVGLSDRNHSWRYGLARWAHQAIERRDASIPVAAARRVTARLRNARFARFAIVEDASHDVHVDAPDELAAAIEGFLEETRSD